MGKLEENSEEILSVALLSAHLVLLFKNNKKSPSSNLTSRMQCLGAKEFIMFILSGQVATE